MINEIYINGDLQDNGYPRTKFLNGYEIRCKFCLGLKEMKAISFKHFKKDYICKSCFFLHFNPMKEPEIKEKHNKIVKSENYRQNMSKVTSGEKNGFYGKKFEKETIEKIRNGNITYWNSLSDEEISYYSKKAKETQSKLKEKDLDYYIKIRSKAARKSHESQFNSEKFKMNSIEKKVFNFLVEIGELPEYSKIFHIYQFDIGIKDLKILIEINGDYWHANPEYYNEEGLNNKKKINYIQEKNKIRDEEKRKWAISAGFNFFELWETDIKNDNFKEIIKNKINEIKKNRPDNQKTI